MNKEHTIYTFIHLRRIFKTIISDFKEEETYLKILNKKKYDQYMSEMKKMQFVIKKLDDIIADLYKKDEKQFTEAKKEIMEQWQKEKEGGE